MKKSFLLLSRLRMLLLTFALMFGCSFAYAQTKTISGVVSNAGLPLPGVNVKVKGGGGTVTDFDGLYTLDANVGDVVEFSSIGFKNQSITVGTNDKIDIVLEEDIEVLDDVVVIGYGTTKKSDLTGSVVSVKAEQIEKTQPVSFEQALVANAPGVRVIASEGGPGSGFKVRIRGATSLLASQDPLYVIDGFPLLTEDGNGEDVSNGAGGSFISPLAGIDPATIESIEVLKDASATAIYGSRGANGVVIITTKSGKKGKPTLTLDTSVGVSTISNQVDILSSQDFINLYNFANPVDSNEETINARDLFFRDRFSLNPIPADELIEFNTRDNAFRNAIITKYSLGVRGGSDKSKYSGTFSYTDQDGIIVNSNFRRFSSNFNLKSKVNDKLDVDFLVNGSLITRDGVVSADTGQGQSVGTITQILQRNPVQQNRTVVLDEDDINTILDFDGDGIIDSINGNLVTDPLRVLETAVNQTNIVNVRSNVSASYKILPNLVFKSTFGGRITSNEGRSFFGREFGRGRRTNGLANRNSRQNFQFVTNNTLKYNNKIGNHRFDVLLGYTLERASGDSFNLRSTEFASDRVNLDQLNGSIPDQIGSGADNAAIQSGIFRFNYDYNKRYLLTLTGRVDDSSRFIDSVGYFPSASVKWRASNESFFKGIKHVINNFSLKASYGLTGNDRIPFGVARQAADIGLLTGFSFVRLDNRELTWESTAQLDLGLELSFFKNRITFEADYFDKTTEDLLYELPISPTSGLRVRGGNTGIFTNLGEVTNKGLELAVNVNVINTKNFKWQTQANITFNSNEVVDVGGIERITDSRFQRNLTDDFIIREGEDVGAFFGLRSAGVYQFEDFLEFDGITDPIERALIFRNGGQANGAVNRNAIDDNLGDASTSSFTLRPGVQRLEGQENYRPGQRKFQDLNGDGIVTLDDDREVLGSVQPEHFGGFTNSFTIHNFDLSFQFNWSYGNEILNKNRFFNTIGSRISQQNLFPEVLNRFSAFNTNTDVPTLNGLAVFSDNASATRVNDDTFVEDASFIRLNNISMGYNLPVDAIKSVGLSGLRLYASVNNVYVWTNYSGFDPETSVGNDPLTPGVDFGAFPRARTFIFGAKATF